MQKNKQKPLADILWDITSQDPRTYYNRGGLGYTYQPIAPQVLIGSKSGTTRTMVTLPSTYGNSARASFQTGEMSKISLSFHHVTGNAETASSIWWRIESSSDGTNWYQILNESVSGGTSTMSTRDFTLSTPSSATAYDFQFPLDVMDKWIRVSVKETGVATNFGSAFVEVMVGGAM